MGWPAITVTARHTTIPVTRSTHVAYRRSIGNGAVKAESVSETTLGSYHGAALGLAPR